MQPLLLTLLSALGTRGASWVGLEIRCVVGIRFPWVSDLRLCYTLAFKTTLKPSDLKRQPRLTAPLRQAQRVSAGHICASALAGSARRPCSRAQPSALSESHSPGAAGLVHMAASGPMKEKRDF